MAGWRKKERKRRGKRMNEYEIGVNASEASAITSLFKAHLQASAVF